MDEQVPARFGANLLSHRWRLCSPGWPHKCWDYEPEPSQTELSSFLSKLVHVSPCMEAHKPHIGTGPVSTANSLGNDRDAGRR